MLYFKYWEVWTPEFVHWNSAAGAWTSWSLDRSIVRVNYTGVAIWEPTSTFSSPCSLDLRSFPFDSQVCTFVFGTWTYTADQVLLQAEESEFSYFYSDVGMCSHHLLIIPMKLLSTVWYVFTTGNLLKYWLEENHEWRVTNLNLTRNDVVTNDKREVHSALVLKMFIERRTSMYTFYVIIPYMISIMLTLSSFGVHVSSPVRLVFTLLSIVILMFLLVFLGSVIIGVHSVSVPYAGELFFLLFSVETLGRDMM